MRISLSKLDKYYGPKRILNLDAFELERGQIFGLVGPNGAGKTTLLRILAGIDMKYTGDVTFDGVSIRRDKKLLKKITYLSQTPYMLCDTVWENIAYPLKIRGLTENEIRYRVDSVIEELSLEDQAYQLATQLSGGEAQKTALARALAFEPNVLLLDEPTASIDLETIDTIENTLKKRNVDQGMTIVMISHNRAQIERLCQTVMTLQNGKLSTANERGVTYV